eukprot:jgi/Galph1/5367/GphlegSOOS_G4101.1
MDLVALEFRKSYPTETRRSILPIFPENALLRQWFFSPYPFMKKLSLQSVLKGHSGCVNTIEWNDYGNLLLSGSDDKKTLLIGRDSVGLLSNVVDRVHSVLGGHSSNIFHVKFVPEYNDNLVVSCSSDRTILVHSLESTNTAATCNDCSKPSCGDKVANIEPFRSYGCHLAAVNKLAFSRDSPHVLFSCSCDGTVRRYDLREPHPICGDAMDNCSNTLVSLSSPRKTCGTEINSLQFNPMNSYYFAVASDSPLVRVYDERRVSPFASDVDLVYGFVPSTIIENHSRPRMISATCVSWSWDGSEILVSYSMDCIYSFRPNENVSWSTDIRKLEEYGAYTGVTRHQLLQSSCRENPSYHKRFQGHLNMRTIKEVSYWGPRSDYVVSGSDCGRVFIWERKSGRLVTILDHADSSIVNCVQGHPFDPILATSGIESNVKIWSPKGPYQDEEYFQDVIQNNLDILKRFTSQQYSTSRIEFVNQMYHTLLVLRESIGN